MRWHRILFLGLVMAAVLWQALQAHAQEMSQEEVTRQLKQAIELQNQGKSTEALAIYEKVLPAAEAVYGKNSYSVGTVLMRMGVANRNLGLFANADPYFQRALPIYEAEFGKDAPQVAGVLFQIGWASTHGGRLAEAEAPLIRSLQIREAHFGKHHTEVAWSLSGLGYLYHARGQYAKAEAAWNRCVDIFEAELGKDAQLVADRYGDLGNLYRDMGQYAKAESFYGRSLQIYEAKDGKDHLNVGHLLAGMSVMHRHLGQYAKAESLALRGLEIREAKLGREHPFVAFSVHELASLYSDLGQYAKAEPLYVRSLKIRQARLGKDRSDEAFTHKDIATFYVRQQRYDLAEKHCLESIRIVEANKLGDHKKLGDVLAIFARVCIAQQKVDEAAQALERGEKILVDAVGKTHDSVADVLQEKASVSWARKDSASAIAQQQQAIEIYKARLGKEHPKTNQAQGRLAAFLHQSKRSTDALRMMDRSFQGLRKQSAQVLPILPESEQLGFMVNTFEKQFHDAVSLALAPAISEENRLRTAGWVVNGKSIIQQSLAERLLLARDNSSSDAKRVLAELEDVRRLLARLHLKGPENALAAFRKEMESLQEKEKSLESQLHAAGLANRNDPWIEIDELRQKLTANTVFVDFLCFAPTDFGDLVSLKRKKQPRIYVAWITSADKETVIVNLGPADQIDAAVRAARQELQMATERIKMEGEPEAEKIARHKLSAVSKLVLEPLLPHVRAYDKWILGPDSNLWLIPWACLPLDDKQYVIEKHTLRCVTSGRDLVLNPLQLDFKSTAPVIFADPDFDLDPSRVAKVDEVDPNRSVRAARGIGKVGRLPGTAFEAKAITPALTKFAKVEPRKFLEREATVGAFQKLKGPKILVVSTHGYFLPDQQVPEHLRVHDVGMPKIVPGLENPLLRSGLLLAGCNQGAKGEQTGVLTGLEIVGTDLRGTELVVLSACETGLGDVRNGEGVAGLRQAFQLAGAQSVVASLWNISDRETPLLMKGLFENISAGQPRVDALREAQLTILRQRRERHAGAHPFYWAAFTITGR